MSSEQRNHTAKEDLDDLFSADTGDQDIDKLVTKIVEFYDEFKTEKLDELSEIYHEDVTFADPIHQVESRAELKDYFKDIMTNVEQCHFAFTDQAYRNGKLFLAWQMRMQHPKLANGREIVMPGVSQFELSDNKIAAQRDHYDMGAMVYEHVPVIGYLVKKVKSRLSND